MRTSHTPNQGNDWEIADAHLRATRGVIAGLAITGLAGGLGFVVIDQAHATHDKPAICHPVAAADGGNQHNGYSLIHPSDVSVHIDENLYPDGVYWKHEHDGRHDDYAVDGACGGGTQTTSTGTTSVPTETTPTETQPTEPTVTVPTTTEPSTVTEPPTTTVPTDEPPATTQPPVSVPPKSPQSQPHRDSGNAVPAVPTAIEAGI